MNPEFDKNDILHFQNNKYAKSIIDNLKIKGYLN